MPGSAGRNVSTLLDPYRISIPFVFSLLRQAQDRKFTQGLRVLPRKQNYLLARGACNAKSPRFRIGRLMLTSSAGRTRTYNQLLTRVLLLLKGVDYIIIGSRCEGLRADF